MTYSIETVTSASQEKMLDFLKSREDYTLFLLGNFEAYGFSLGEAPYSGNFKLICLGGEVVGVFALTQVGTLLIESVSSESIFDKVIHACRQEPIPLKGVIGNWEFCKPFWQYLKTKKNINREVFASKAILYTVSLKRQRFLPQPNVRVLTKKDYDQWKLLKLSYSKEEGRLDGLSDKQLFDLFLDKTKKNISWGYFFNDTLVSIADLNAKAFDLGQVGSVYTDPKFRRKGYSKAVMRQLLQDAKALHSIRKLAIFTDENNFSAQKLYTSLGASRVGYFAILFA